jgi:hypothetical protein
MLDETQLCDMCCEQVFYNYPGICYKTPLSYNTCYQQMLYWYDDPGMLCNSSFIGCVMSTCCVTAMYSNVIACIPCYHDIHTVCMKYKTSFSHVEMGLYQSHDLI